MNIVRFEPWSIIDQISHDLNRRPASDRAQTATADWIPAVDIVEEKDNFILEVTIPKLPALQARRITVEAA